MKIEEGFNKSTLQSVVRWALRVGDRGLSLRAGRHQGAECWQAMEELSLPSFWMWESHQNRPSVGLMPRVRIGALAMARDQSLGDTIPLKIMMLTDLGKV